MVAATIGISGSFRWRARRTGDVIERRREGVWFALGRSVVALPLFGSVLLYVLRPDWMEWSALPMPMWLRWIGFVLAALAVPCAWWVFSSLGRNVSETVLTKTDHSLVTAGPYRWVRHPLYGTGGILLVGVGLMAANWFILLFALLAVVLIRGVVVPIEERALTAKFGDAYRVYMRDTGGMLPRLAAGSRVDLESGR